MITAIGQISTIILHQKHPGYKAPGFIRGVISIPVTPFGMGSGPLGVVRWGMWNY